MLNISLWYLPVVILAITLHEAAHGWMAYNLGDPTAKDAGRVTLNPIPHIDILGTVVVPCTTLFLVGVPFGWAKSVPIRPMFLRRPKEDMAWVAAAGPLANALFGGLFALMFFAAGVTAYIARLYGWDEIEWAMDALMTPLFLCVIINAIFLLFNLIPVPPLDGGRVVTAMMPHGKVREYIVKKVEPYGITIVLLTYTIALIVYERV